MTQDEIFDAARQSHLDVYALGRDKSQFIYRLEAFAKLVEDAAFKRWAAQTKLVVDAEREACLKICEAQAQTNYWEGADVCAEEIRARGQE